MLSKRDRVRLSLLAGSVLALAAPMVSRAQTLKYIYQYYQPPTSPPIPTRSPTRTANAGHFVDLSTISYCSTFVNSGQIPQTASSAANPGTVNVSAGQRCTGSAQQPVYQLAYVNLSGGPSGPVTVFADANGLLKENLVQQAFPSGSHVVAQAVYFVIGGSGPPCAPACSSASYVDEYNDTLGQLADDPFVNVDAPPGTPDAAENATANTNGYFDTTHLTAAVQAYASTASAGTFVGWVMAPATGAGGIAGATLTVNQGADASALAHYASCSSGLVYNWNANLLVGQCVVPLTSVPQPSPCQQSFNFLQQIDMDRGPLLLVGQKQKLWATLATCVAEGKLNGAAVANLESQYGTIGLSREGGPVRAPVVP